MYRNIPVISAREAVSDEKWESTYIIFFKGKFRQEFHYLVDSEKGGVL